MSHSSSLAMDWNQGELGHGSPQRTAPRLRAVAPSLAPQPGMALVRGVWNAPVLVCLGVVVFSIGWTALPGIWGGLCIVGIFATVASGVMHKEFHGHSWNDWYEQLLGAALPFSVLTLVAAVVGGIVQILPTVIINRAENLEGARQIPYTPLELAGRDIYVREGCYNCHSQQIRTLEIGRAHV